MPKYIDLLRGHQSPSEPANSAPVEEPMLFADEPEQMQTALATSEELLPDEHSTLQRLPGMSPGYSDTSAWLYLCTQHLLTLFQAATANRPATIEMLTQQLRLQIAKLHLQQEAQNDLELEVAKQLKTIRAIDSELGDLIEKSIMMMLYSFMIGLRLRWSEEELLYYALAGMLHHIGMAQVAPEIRHKREQLNDQERGQIMHAPARAESYLRLCGVNDMRILAAVTQSGERFDGSGAKGLIGLDIAPSARLVGLLATFQAMIHFRPYRKRLMPRDAIRDIVGHHKTQFDPHLLKALIEAVSLYPVGTFVQLNTGDIGQVIRVHPRLPLRPTVFLAFDRNGQAINPREVNLTAQPNLMVQACMYEEEVEAIRHPSGKQASANQQ